MVPRSCASTGEGGITQTRGVEKKKKTMYNYQIYISVRYSRLQKNPGGAGTRAQHPPALSASPCVPAQLGRWGRSAVVAVTFTG